MPEAPRAVHSLGYNPLTYADPTGEEVVRRLDGDVLISWPDGFTVRLSQSDAGPVLHLLEKLYSFRQSRRGHVWGIRKKSPVLLAQEPGKESDTYNDEGTNYVSDSNTTICP